MNNKDTHALVGLYEGFAPESESKPIIGDYELQQASALFDEIKAKYAPDSELTVADYIVDTLSDEYRIEGFFNN